MNNFYILEINVNNQLRHAYSAETKKKLLRQIKLDDEYDDEYYLIYQYDLDNSIKILFENESIQKIEDFLLK
jgi:hypothetical protein|tara:strand:- start:379 stop:594 length:216 start_codon:yes stop_codon:yes gene_type:complete